LRRRNALNHALRGELLDALVQGDADPAIRVQIVRGAGTCFSAGYDLGGGDEGRPLPFFTAAGDGQWPRHVTTGWMGIWDLAKPVIAQVHGYCLAGGSELATGCDIVYCADDAKIGYPEVDLGVCPAVVAPWQGGEPRPIRAADIADARITAYLEPGVVGVAIETFWYRHDGARK